MKPRRTFADFHRANPHVFAKYRQVAEALRKGQRRGSSEQVYQILRWEMRFNTDESLSGSFKLNNYYRRQYAMLLVKVDPSFNGWFRFRKQRKVKNANR